MFHLLDKLKREAKKDNNTQTAMPLQDYFFEDKLKGRHIGVFRAMAHYRKAAENGNPRAAYYLGRLYAIIDSAQYNPSKAIGWFRVAVTRDRSILTDLIDLASRYNEQVKQDISYCELAVALYKLILQVDNSNGLAANELGCLLGMKDSAEQASSLQQCTMFQNESLRRVNRVLSHLSTGILSQSLASRKRSYL